MRSILVVGALVLASAISVRAAEFDHQHATWTAWLENHVQGGLVDYTQAKSDRKLLDRYIRELEAVQSEDYAGWSKEEKMAYWINAYNALAVRLVVDRYPIQSIKKIGIPFLGPWKKKLGTLVGRRHSLDSIEHGILRSKFKDHRVHAAVVCASMSCPELQDQAFSARNLDRQLEAAMAKFINDERRNRVHGKSGNIEASEIFDWLRKDFERDHGKNAIAKLFKKYSTDVALKSKPDDEIRIRFLEYDWSLNDRARQKK